MPDILDGEFAYKTYKKILETLKASFELHYLIREIPQILSQIHQPKVILRHDVTDYLEKALTMAEIEHGLSIRTTYMITINSSSFNINDTSSLNIISRINRMGHEVGFCLNNSQLEKSDISEVERMIQTKSAILEKQVKFPIFSVSLLNPISKTPPKSLFLGKKINASCYLMMKWSISDKKMPWKAEDIIAKSTKPYQALLQVITRPHLWGTEESEK